MPQKISTIKLELLKIEEDGFHIMINAYIGRKKIRLLVDTGASKTIFDKTRLSKIIGEENSNFENVEQLSTGLGTNDMESQTVDLKILKIGDIKINNNKFVVLDLSHVNTSYKLIGDKGIDGVLGSDLLHSFNAAIYFKTKLLKLYY